MYVFVENKNIGENKNIREQNLNNLMLHRNNKMVWAGVSRHNLHTEGNDHLCCG